MKVYDVVVAETLCVGFVVNCIIGAFLTVVAIDLTQRWWQEFSSIPKEDDTTNVISMKGRRHERRTDHSL